MLIFIAFLITMAACVNWLLIGLLQYDFVAGIFGFQGSVFSRLIYIIFGAAAIFLLVKTLIQKGHISIFSFKRKENRKKEDFEHEQMYTPKHHGGYDSEDGRIRQGMEVSHEFPHRNYEEDYEKKEYNSLFDEHFSNDD